MENPATWGEAEKVVGLVLREYFAHQAQVLAGTEEPLCGLSLERKITDALRKAGLLKDEVG